MVYLFIFWQCTVLISGISSKPFGRMDLIRWSRTLRWRYVNCMQHQTFVSIIHIFIFISFYCIFYLSQSWLTFFQMLFSSNSFSPHSASTTHFCNVPIGINLMLLQYIFYLKLCMKCMFLLCVALPFLHFPYSFHSYSVTEQSLVLFGNYPVVYFTHRGLLSILLVLTP